MEGGQPSSNGEESRSGQNWNAIDRQKSWSTILKVPYLLRKVNENAYTPRLISIGPYHHGSPHLEEMEVFKKQCFDRIAIATGRSSPEDFMLAVNTEEACNFYSSSVDLINERDKWKKVMIVDGCFIVQLLCGKRQDIIGPIFRKRNFRITLFHDFLLLENQLPFSVLVNLYQIMTNHGLTDGKCFASEAFSKLSPELPGPRNWTSRGRPITEDSSNIKHLLSLVHDNWTPSGYGINCHGRYRYQNRGRTTRDCGHRRERLGPRIRRCLRRLRNAIVKGINTLMIYWKSICCASARDEGNVAEWQSIRCTSELEEAGIRFVKLGVNKDTNSADKNVESLFDISFENATLKIPTFVVSDNTERLLRNFIAYELYIDGPTYVKDYVTLMDNLINSAKDVQRLRHRGVVENMLGDDEAFAQMINKLREHVTPCGNSFFYEETFAGLKKHCAKR